MNVKLKAGDIILWHPVLLSTLHPSLRIFGANVLNILLQYSQRSVRASECVGAFIVDEKTYCAFEIISVAVQGRESVFLRTVWW